MSRTGVAAKGLLNSSSVLTNDFIVIKTVIVFIVIKITLQVSLLTVSNFPLADCAEFVNCSFSSKLPTQQSPGPARARALCHYHVLPLTSWAAPLLAGCSSRAKSPPVPRLPG